MVSANVALLVSVLSAPAQSELLYFSASWCQPCRTMRPVISQLQLQGFPIRHVDIDRKPALVDRFSVKSIPCFVMIAGGREVDRVVGATTYNRLARMFPRRRPHASVIRGQSNDERSGLSRLGSKLGNLPGLGRTKTDNTAAEPTSAQPDANHAVATEAIANEAARAIDGGARAMAATVRLKIEDAQGFSYGTGTIIDVHGDEALVVTCGHIFRSSQGKGRITVDVFGPGARETIPGTLVGFDDDRDIGLVSIRPKSPVTAVPVAGTESRPRAGHRVFSIGCDRGGEPSRIDSHIAAVNRYLGPENLSVEGQPVDGRSGGGLFSADGTLIGVCNAADPADNQGLYAAAATIRKELDRFGLAFIHQQTDPDVAMSSRNADPNVAVASHKERLASLAPTGKVGPVSRHASAEFAETAARSRPAPTSLDSAGSEVICIIRPCADADAPSNIIVIERPSEKLLETIRRAARTKTRTGPVF